MGRMFNGAMGWTGFNGFHWWPIYWSRSRPVNPNCLCVSFASQLSNNQTKGSRGQWIEFPQRPTHKRRWFPLLNLPFGSCVCVFANRNGLRPSRYYVTKENVVVMASEVGVYDVDPVDVVHKVSWWLWSLLGLFSWNCLNETSSCLHFCFLKGRLEPSRMLLIDTVQRVIIGDDQLKMDIARNRPYSSWLSHLLTLDDLRKASAPSSLETSGGAPLQLLSSDDIRKQLSLFNYTLQTLTLLLVVPKFTTK